MLIPSDGYCLIVQAIVNGGFETGDLSGWGVYPNGGSITVESSWNSYSPVEGNYFALIDPKVTNSNDNYWAVLGQTFAMNPGDTISGYSAFYTTDSTSYYDYGYVEVVMNSTGGNLVWGSTVVQTTCLWQPWSFTAGTASDNYQLRAASGNYNYPDHCYLLVDGVTFTSANTNPVPEPMTMLLLGPALLGLVGFKKRKA